MTEFKDTLAALSAPFHPTEVKQRNAGGNKKLDYVDWTAVVRRLNEVCPGWEMDSNVVHFSVVSQDGKAPQYVAVVEVSLMVPHNTDEQNLIVYGATNGGFITRTGVGSDVHGDPDKVVKTAQAEALKKAGNQFGIALELWSEDHRNMLENYCNEDVGSLKRKVMDNVPGITAAKDKAKAIKDHYDLPADADLNNLDTLVEILNRG